jgi:hypothetical protein
MCRVAGLEGSGLWIVVGGADMRGVDVFDDERGLEMWKEKIEILDEMI